MNKRGWSSIVENVAQKHYSPRAGLKISINIEISPSHFRGDHDKRAEVCDKLMESWQKHMDLIMSVEDGRHKIDDLSVREALSVLLVENKIIYNNLKAIQERSGRILEYAREARKKVLELNGPDMGPAG